MIAIFLGVGYAIFHSLMGTIAMITVGDTLLNILDMAINFYYLDKKYLWKYILIAVGYTVLIGGELCLKYFIK